MPLPLLVNEILTQNCYFTININEVTGRAELGSKVASDKFL